MRVLKDHSAGVWDEMRQYGVRVGKRIFARQLEDLKTTLIAYLMLTNFILVAIIFLTVL